MDHDLAGPRAGAARAASRLRSARAPCIARVRSRILAARRLAHVGYRCQRDHRQLRASPPRARAGRRPSDRRGRPGRRGRTAAGRGTPARARCRGGGRAIRRRARRRSGTRGSSSRPRPRGVPRRGGRGGSRCRSPASSRRAARSRAGTAPRPPALAGRRTASGSGPYAIRTSAAGGGGSVRTSCCVPRHTGPVPAPHHALLALIAERAHRAGVQRDSRPSAAGSPSHGRRARAGRDRGRTRARHRRRSSARFDRAVDPRHRPHRRLAAAALRSGRPSSPAPARGSWASLLLHTRRSPTPASPRAAPARIPRACGLPRPAQRARQDHLKRTLPAARRRPPAPARSPSSVSGGSERPVCRPARLHRSRRAARARPPRADSTYFRAAASGSPRMRTATAAARLSLYPRRRCRDVGCAGLPGPAGRRRWTRGLSRWLWLVKWLLAIPHFIVLAVLWIAFVVAHLLRVLRHPVHRALSAGLFDFNVGVLRWTWRVTYYALQRARHRPLPAVHATGEPDTRRLSRSSTRSACRAGWCS